MSRVELCLWRSHLVVDVCGEVWGLGEMEEKKWKENWRQRTCPCCEMSRKSRASNGFYIFWIGSQDAKTKDHT